jgi:uncharacterized protein (DUF2225 family)
MFRIAAAAVLLAAVARATTWEEITVECPVCANKFEARSWMSTNEMGAPDRDFCKHAAGGQVFMFAIWTCPKCAYTGYRSDFLDEEVPKELVARLKRENPLKRPVPFSEDLKDTEDIPTWARYDLYDQVLALQDAKASSRAWTLLRAAWSQRFDWWSIVPKELQEAEKPLAKKYEDQLDGWRYSSYITLGSLVEKHEKGDLLLLGAGYYLFRGESPAADRLVKRLEERKDLSPAMKEAVADFRARIDREREYLARALPLFRKSVATAEHPADILYLCGEIERKLGRHADAIRTLTSLLADERVPYDLARWVKDALDKTEAARKR